MKQKITTTKIELYQLGRKLGLCKEDINDILASKPNYMHSGLNLPFESSPVDMYKGDGGWYSTISINDFH